jgi:hypothetical protein
VTPAITYCSAVCPVNNATNDISSGLKIPIIEISDSSNNILFSCLSRKQSLISIIGILKSELMSFLALFTGQTAEHYVIAGVTNLNYWYFEARTDVVSCIVYWTNS